MLIKMSHTCLHMIGSSNLNIKGLSEWEANRPLLRSIRTVIRDTPIQADAQIVFWLGDKSDEYW